MIVLYGDALGIPAIHQTKANQRWSTKNTVRILSALSNDGRPVVAIFEVSGTELGDPGLDDAQVTGDVVFVRCQSVSLLQTLLGAAQVAALHVYHAKIMVALNVHRVQV